MTLQTHTRARRFTPSAIIAGLLLSLAACATNPNPPAPIYGGGDRVPVTGDPSAPNTGSPGETGTGATDTGLGGIDPAQTASPDGLTPPHMAGVENIKRAAVLLPFSHPNARVRNEAQGMLAGIEMALFDQNGGNILLMPKDTAGVQSQAEAVAIEAMNEGADIVLGPLFSANVQRVNAITRQQGVPVIAFSNTRAAAGGGAYLASITPEEEVAQVVDYAASLGVRSYAFMGPRNELGQRLEQALRFEASRRGGTVITSGFYDPSNSSPTDQAKAVASAIQAEVRTVGRGKVAVLIPERGQKLLGVAPLLAYHGMDIRYVKLLGTSAWNDSSIWREPTLAGGLYAAPPPEDMERFATSYQRIYGQAPSELAGLSYDAGAMTFQLLEEGGETQRGITNYDGFRGVNGLFRFRSDGTTERGLAIMKVTPQGPEVVRPGRDEFGLSG